MTSPLYIVARTVLLDALDALGEQRDAVVLVGAQAIYLHTGDADIAVPAFTTDGDLVIEPSRLKDEPKLAEAMARAHFQPGLQPGSWLSMRVVDSVPTTIPIDLLVPEAVAGAGRRGARAVTTAIEPGAAPVVLRARSWNTASTYCEPSSQRIHERSRYASQDRAPCSWRRSTKSRTAARSPRGNGSTTKTDWTCFVCCASSQRASWQPA